MTRRLSLNQNHNSLQLVGTDSTPFPISFGFRISSKFWQRRELHPLRSPIHYCYLRDHVFSCLAHHLHGAACCRGALPAIPFRSVRNVVVLVLLFCVPPLQSSNQPLIIRQRL